MNVVAFAGGVGGAKLVDGLAYCLDPLDLTVVVNTGDDFDLMGLRICPDLDTVCYTLAGIANPDSGWGQKDETWNALNTLKKLGAADWFRIGDKDIGYHLDRTNRLNAGETLSTVVKHFCESFGVQTVVLPMSDEKVSTYVYSKSGELYAFQEYFVQMRCEPEVSRFEFEGIEKAKPAPGVLSAIMAADCIVFCPSNPWVSIDPILGVPGIRKALTGKLIVAVSPIIGGKAVKGPAAKMYSELGIAPSSVAVSKHYTGLIKGIVIDTQDEKDAKKIIHQGIIPIVTNTLMRNFEDRAKLAAELLQFCESQSEGEN